MQGKIMLIWKPPHPQGLILWQKDPGQVALEKEQLRATNDDLSRESVSVA